ncbi:YcxB family protein [bacterium]|nr:YcxB family protein [bacterium]
MESPLTIKFTPEKNDYVQASRALANKTPAFIVLAIVTVLLMIGALVVLIVPSIGDSTWNNVAIISLVIGAFYLIYYFVLIPMQLGRSFKSNDLLREERVLVFDESGVTMTLADRRSDMVWDKFEKLMDSKSLYMMIYKADQRLYPFVPKRAFETPELEAAFRQLFSEHDIPVK